MRGGRVPNSSEKTGVLSGHEMLTKRGQEGKTGSGI